MNVDPDDAVPEPEPGDLGLGHDHWLRWLFWSSTAPEFAHIPPTDRFGAIILHRNPATGERCMGGVRFPSETQRAVDPRSATWDVSSWEPLTISPSVLCRRCGDHGFVRDGEWVTA